MRKSYSLIHHLTGCLTILCEMYALFQNLFFKYTWNNFLHLQVELCVAAIVRPCVHEMRLQPGFGSQEKSKPQDTAQDNSSEVPTSEASDPSENSAHNLLVTHVGFIDCALNQMLFNQLDCGLCELNQL